MKNTKFSYLYRDASNYKAFRELVLEGKLTRKDIQDVLEDGANFIPEQVGLPELQAELGQYGAEFPSEDDHVWHEIDSIAETDEEPNFELTAKQVKQLFLDVKKVGWKVLEASERLGVC